MRRKLRLPSPALVIALVSLFVALTSTGWAQNVVPLAKRALTADKAKVATNAQRLNGRTATQIAATPGPATDAATLNGQTAAQIAAAPGPATSLPAGAITYRTQSWSVSKEKGLARDTAFCPAGEKAIGGGWDQSSGVVLTLTDRPVPDGPAGAFTCSPRAATTCLRPARYWAVCLKVS